jgi:hypothetical protein
LAEQGTGPGVAGDASPLPEKSVAAVRPLIDGTHDDVIAMVLMQLQDAPLGCDLDTDGTFVVDDIYVRPAPNGRRW